MPYIILELADGDVRHRLRKVDRQTAWALRALHHTATGLMQLHSQRIAHQDLRPSAKTGPGYCYPGPFFRMRLIVSV